jgi:transcriptional regulator
VSDAPASFIEAQLRAIVGIEIPITRLFGKWKVSQNKSAADRAGVAEGLRRTHGSDAEALARLVEGSREA